MSLGSVVEVTALGSGVTRQHRIGNGADTRRPHTSGVNRCTEAPPARRRRADDVVRTRDLLRAEVLDGRWGTGLLPSESDLMLRYAVGRNVTRDVLDLLRDEGLVERVPGSGTFVVNAKSRHRFDRMHSVHDSQTTDRRVRGRFVTVSVRSAPGPVAAGLGLPAGAPCALLEFVTTVGGAPVAVSTSYLHREVAGMVRDEDFSGDFYQFPESLGIDVSSGDESVEAVAAENWSAGHLQIPVGAPVMLFRRRLVDSDDTVVEMGFIRFRGDAISLDVRLPRTNGEDIR